MQRISPSGREFGNLAEPESFLSLLQLTDSAFPIGRYTQSFGLETFAQSGAFGTPNEPGELTALLADWLRFGVAPSDGVALACAHRAVGPRRVVDTRMTTQADRRLTAVKLARETREASLRTGRALLRTVETVFGATTLRPYIDLVESGRTPGNHAIALGLLSASLDVPRLLAVFGELFATCASWVAAAVRLGVTDHQAAQLVLHQTRAVCVLSARKAVDGRVRDISSCTPLPDVMAMRHEYADPRLFAS